MIMQVYSIKDLKVGFSEPFASQNDSEALRRFIATVQSDRPNFCNTFPEDKELHFIGTFDTETGTLSNAEGPRFLGSALSYVVQRTQQAPFVAPSQSASEEGDESKHDA